MLDLAGASSKEVQVAINGTYRHEWIFSFTSKNKLCRKDVQGVFSCILFSAASSSGLTQLRRAAKSKEGGSTTRYNEAEDQYLKIPVLVKQVIYEPFYTYIDANAFMNKDTGGELN